jgi:hemolysin D
VRNEDVGFIQPSQRAQVKLAAYPFQRYGMLAGTVSHIGADASEAPARGAQPAPDSPAGYKVRIALDTQQLRDSQGRLLQLTPGMQAVAEIHQGRRSVLDYLLSPVQKAISESGRER